MVANGSCSRCLGSLRGQWAERIKPRGVGRSIRGQPSARAIDPWQAQPELSRTGGLQLEAGAECMIAHKPFEFVSRLSRNDQVEWRVKSQRPKAVVFELRV